MAKEIQSNFAQIEQVLDGFFRDTDRRAELSGLDVPFRQVAGALTMMRHDAAATDFQQKATERCNADDDQRADAFSAQGLGLLGR